MKKIVLFLFLFNCIAVLAQETEFPLYSNPVLKNAEKLSHRAAPGDTLSLPFKDDFSQTWHFPDASRWLDNAVFINSDMPYSPPTIGVATFDGLKSDGLPYTFGIISGRTDSLTSKPIKLGGYTNLDNIYLSFYYQMKGRGDMPEDEDTLVLEFHPPADSGAWKKVWSRVGSSNSSGDTLFRFVNIPIVDTSYLKDGFQFRFRTFGGRYGNIDLWHLDYVYLNHTRNASDSTYNDVAFISPLHSILNNFTAVPWSHYKYNPIGNASSVETQLKNLHGTNTSNSAYGGAIYNSNWTQIATIGNNTNPISPGETKNISFAIPANPFPDLAGKQFEHFIIKAWNNPGGGDDLPQNDTVSYVQRFYDYYAYDDGTAEAGYGVLSPGAQIAMKFNPLKTGDTLKAIQMYFTYMVDDVRDKHFRLMVWGDNAGKPGAVLFQQDVFVNPQYDGLVDFHIYDISEANLVINGPFYIGWLQETFDILNIGVDKNTNANAFMFYRTTQVWNQTQFTGAWMMRPMFGARYPYGVEEKLNVDGLQVFPNPSSETIYFDKDLSGSQYMIYDLSGSLIRSGLIQGTSIQVNDIPQGMYLLKAGEHAFKKIIISR